MKKWQVGIVLLSFPLITAVFILPWKLVAIAVGLFFTVGCITGGILLICSDD